MLAVKPVHRVLGRHNLLMGGERDLVLLSALVLGGVAFSSMNLPTAGVCVGLWLFAIWGFRQMAKHDPMLSRVYKRTLKYKGFYDHSSRPYRLH